MRRKSLVPLFAVLMCGALAGNLLAVASAPAALGIAPPIGNGAVAALTRPAPWPGAQRSQTSPSPRSRPVPPGGLREPAPVIRTRAPMSAIGAGGGAIALTFDDGPDPRYTPVVLALLAQYHLHATFCVVGVHAHEYPELLRAIVAGGNSLCNHTYNHDEHIGQHTPAQIADDLRRTDAAIVAATGQRPRYFRAPAGNWTPALLTAVGSDGMVPLGWTVDPRDWARPGVPSIVGTTLAQLHPGGILLMHDGFGHREQSVAALKLLLPVLAARRMHPVPL